VTTSTRDTIWAVGKRVAREFWRGQPRTPRGKVAIDPAQGGWNALWGFTSTTSDDQRWTGLTDTEREGLYAKHALVFACVRKVTTALARAPLQIGVTNTDGRFEPGNHPMLDVWNQPNPDYAPNHVVQLLAARLMLTGTCYLWKWRQGAGRAVTELWPVPTGWVDPVKGASDTSRLVSSYKVHTGGGMKTVTATPGDMAAGWFIDPESTLGGVGCFEAAAHDIQLDQDRENYLADMLDNLELPGFKIETDERLGPDERADLRAALYDRIGKGSRGKSLILSGGARGEVVAPLKDLDWPGLAGMNESRICAAAGVPPIIVGARVGLDRSTFANYAEARTSFYEDTVVPFWSALQDILTLGLLRGEGDYIHQCRFDTSAIGELQEDMGKRVERATRLWQSGLITRARAKEMVGEVPGPSDDVYVRALGVDYVPASSAS